MKQLSFLRFAALCGLAGPLVFGLVLVIMTVFKFDFLRSLGWDPLSAPTFDWPSGLALGPYGWIMTTTFVLAGLGMSVFASGLREGLKLVRLSGLGCWLLCLAGLGLLGLASTTDPTIRSTPATWHGMLHDFSFAFLGIMLVPAILLLGIAFRRDPRWKDLSFFTFIILVLVFPTFWLKGAAFYIFLAAILLWSELVALRLWRLTR